MASGFLVPLLKPEEADQTLFANSVSHFDLKYWLLCLSHILWTQAGEAVDTAYKNSRGLQTNRCVGQEILGENIKQTIKCLQKELGWYSRKYGHSKVATCKEDLRRLHAYTGKMHIQKSPEKTISLHLRLIRRLWVSLVNLWRATPAQNSLQRLGYEGVLSFWFFLGVCWLLALKEIFVKTSPENKLKE